MPSLSYRVVAPTAAVHREPRRDSGLVSEVLYGQTLEVSTPRAERDYVWMGCGWVHSNQLTESDGREAEWDWVVTDTLLQGHTQRVLPIGARVDRRYTAGGSVIPAAEWDGYAQEHRMEIVTASLDGAPYRPGGVTSWGVDCSGLTWAAYRAAGITLPRHVAGLTLVGKEVPKDPDAWQFGDLVLVAGRNGDPRHVALALGNGRVQHARMTTCGCIRTEHTDLGGAVWEVRRLLEDVA
jgi:hypothetical protein